MFKRQMRVLCLLYHAGGSLERLRLVKYCFIAAQEASDSTDSTYYDFVPFLYGPYSFQLKHEIVKLEKAGLLRSSNKYWELTEEVLDNLANFSKNKHDEAASIVDRYGRFTIDELLDYVYNNYKWFTINSSNPKETRPTGAIAIHTAGYEGKSIDSFLNTLLSYGIKSVIDVRYNPIARTYGFHKNTFASILQKLNIAYYHVRTLGIPSDKRRYYFLKKDIIGLLQFYKSKLLPNQTESLNQIKKIVSSSPSVLLCMESDPSQCHRTLVAEEIKKDLNISIIKL